MSTFSDDLNEKITKEYDELKNHAEIKNMMKAIEHSSSYEDAYNLAKKVSNKLANIMSDNLPSDAYYGTLMAILEPSINNLYKDIDDACRIVQTNKNVKDGLGIKPQSAKRSNDINSIMAHKLSMGGDYETVLQDYSCEVVDKNLKANMDFADALGYEVKITRKYDGVGLRNRKVDCTWCLLRAGTRTFKNATQAGESGMLARHQGCGCIIDYENTKTKTKKIISKGKISQLLGLGNNQKASNVTQAYDMLVNDIGFNMIEDSFKRIDPELIVSNTNQLKKLEDRFGVVHKSKGTICSVRDRNAMAYVNTRKTDPTRQNLSLCPAYYKDKNVLISEEFKGRKTFHTMPFKDEYVEIYTVTHEYGHMLQNLLVRQRFEADGWTENNPTAFTDMSKKTSKAMFKWYSDRQNAVAKECKDEIIQIAKDNNPNFDINMEISTYGKTDRFEFFAEVFANSQCGAPNELGKAMQIWLQKKGF